MRTTMLLVALLYGCTVETEGLTDLLPAKLEAAVTCPDQHFGLPSGETVDLPDGWRCAACSRDGRVEAECEHGDTLVTLRCDLEQDVATSIVQLGRCNVQVWCE